MIQANFKPNYYDWKTEAESFLKQKIAPEQINWNQSEISLLSTLPLKRADETYYHIDWEDIDKFCKPLSYARDEDRWSFLYKIIYRYLFENHQLFHIFTDPDIRRANLLKKSISRDIHKMHAFVRFKNLVLNGRDHYIAWHEPEHLIIKPGSYFFKRRFGDKPWSIFSSDESAHWNTKELVFSHGLPQEKFTLSDSWDDVWKSYYKSIFNPHRIKLKAMRSEMPRKYWKSMPETQLIEELIREKKN